MELRVESAQGHRLPNDCYVGIRVGDVLKQGRYEPQRCYHFPQVDRRRNAKIDIYQHIGSCVVAVDPDTKAQHEVNVSGADPSMPGAKLLVNVQSRSDDSSKQQRDERTKALKNQAKEYLSKHSIEERLSEAVKALLKEQPEDPTLFLCNHLGGSPPSKADSKLETAGKVDASAKTAEVEAPVPAKELPAKEPVAIPDTKAAEKEEPVAIPDSKASARAKAANVLIKAAEDGSLEQALQETKQQLRGENQGTNQTVRNKAAQLLSAAADSGALEQALRESVGSERDYKAAVQVKAANLLTQAAESGELERALVEVIGPSTKQSSARERAAQVLTQAAENGDLERALDEVRGKDTQQSKTDNIRAKAAQVLLAAAENGTLDDALAETRGERQAATKPSQGSNAEDIRLLAGKFLHDAVQDGRLENALREVSAASEDTKPQGSDAVRTKAAKLLLQAEGSGELEAIVKEVKSETNQSQGEKPKENVEPEVKSEANQGQGEKPKKSVEPEVKSEANQGRDEKTQKTEQVRQKASNLLMSAADNGDLEKVLREVNNNKTGSKVDSSPPIVMNSMAMGPAYNNMGMQPGLLFI